MTKSVAAWPKMKMAMNRRKQRHRYTVKDWTKLSFRPILMTGFCFSQVPKKVSRMAMQKTAPKMRPASR